MIIKGTTASFHFRAHRALEKTYCFFTGAPRGTTALVWSPDRHFGLRQYTRCHSGHSQRRFEIGFGHWSYIGGRPVAQPIRVPAPRPRGVPALSIADRGRDSLLAPRLVLVEVPA